MNVPPEFSSPACLMHEAGDIYMGYAGREELIRFLNELAEVVRASARVALEGKRTDSAVTRTGARWCAMLDRHLEALGAKPSSDVGALYGEAMAIAELRDRIAFVDRGLSGLLAGLREILPRVRDNQLHADLSEMLRSSEVDIESVTRK